MKTSDFYYDLPQELIAQDPLENRSGSRLLYLNRMTGAYADETFTDIKKYLKAGDCLVINDTKVIPARLYGVKEDTKAKVEILLLKRKSDTDWECLVRPGKKCRPGAVIDFGDGTTSTDRKAIHKYMEAGTYTITLTVTDDSGNISTCTKEITVSVVDPIYYGAGATASAITTKASARKTPAGRYNFTAAAGDSLFVICPVGMSVQGMRMSGIDIPLEGGTGMVIDEKSYLCYQSSNVYDAGNYVIEVY
jgi:hypothetical protein